jgi:F1F0 ATPase subunit 2
MVLALFAVSGALIALAYAASLAWNTRLYLSPKAAGWPVLLHAIRISAVVAALVGLALAGPRPFLAALVGFACAQATAVLAMRRRA